MSTQAPAKDHIVSYLKDLRDSICAEFLSLEDSSTSFERKNWNYADFGLESDPHRGSRKGGGEISLLRGKVFEKAAVNWSGVEGGVFPGKDSSGPFFATGVSLITHMSNPMAPTVHFNIRFLTTEDKFWWGGGFDLTPMGFPREEDTLHFHKVAQDCLDPFGAELYPKYKQAAAEYFYIPHRQKERGVGGIFFDHVNTGNVDRDFAMWKSVGDNFLEAIMPIYRRSVDLDFNNADKETQLIHRGHYAEFNLAYDRGTKFGFQSGGNPDAILCSMPPLAKW